MADGTHTYCVWLTGQRQPVLYEGVTRVELQGRYLGGTLLLYTDAVVVVALAGGEWTTCKLMEDTPNV